MFSEFRIAFFSLIYSSSRQGTYMSGKYNKGKRKPSHVQTKRSPSNEYHWRIQTDYAKRQLQRKQYFKIKNAA